MKKWFYVFAVLCMMCVGFSACGGDDENGGSFVVNEVQLLEKEWTVQGGRLTLYKNHMAYYDFGGSAVNGALGAASSVYYGSWSLSNNVLDVSFSTNMAAGVEASSRNFTHKIIGFKGTQVLANNVYGNPNDTIWYKRNGMEKDFTDASEHDGALHGVWKMDVSVPKDGNKVSTTCVITFGSDGKVNYKIELVGMDITEDYQTKNGVVTLNNFPIGNAESILYYTRTSETFINFWNIRNGYRAFTLYAQ